MKKLIIFTLFPIIAACGADDSEKFIGKWVDQAPEQEGKLAFGLKIPASDDSLKIEPAKSGSVSLTTSVMGRDRTFVYPVIDNKIMNGTRVIYTLDGDTLTKSSTGTKLVRAD